MRIWGLLKGAAGGVLAALFAFAPPASAQTNALVSEFGAPEFALPVDCQPGKDCFIQNLVDQTPGPGFRDFACGALGYDGHKGVDFALPTMAAMERGVFVRAARGGTVRGVRDGMPDQLPSGPDDPAIAGRECGNGVVIAHENGWESQYCHMSQGTILVKPGDEVETGDRLGLIGLSGKTQFPHLHFALRKDGAVIDPFDRDGRASLCSPNAQGVWAAPFTPTFGGIINAGFATDIPDFQAVKSGLPETPPIASDAGALVIWVHMFGTRAGDRLDLRIDGPQGVIFEQSVVMEKPQARSMRAGGRRNRGGLLKPGEYTATATLTRAGRAHDTARTSLVIGAP
jgi:hypothetical protein